MKSFYQLLIIFASILSIYKWRYRILNAILAVPVLRRYAVRISMNMPQMRSKVLPSLFSEDINK
ncbi:hypothetical protein [Oceanobacillus halophilus]|uniref:Sodium:proton antiporter n=1 Tax=Oceanobacillus halophilus TaxID=930130 RepID=A0A495AGP8_9BACI|nr:hypothetical protein [Oceanobacillus halophilus]RKQ37795.1 hypothetical protein D8M06_03045 [Oceanobacillus halophilus]